MLSTCHVLPVKVMYCPLTGDRQEASHNSTKYCSKQLKSSLRSDCLPVVHINCCLHKGAYEIHFERFLSVLFRRSVSCKQRRGILDLINSEKLRMLARNLEPYFCRFRVALKFLSEAVFSSVRLFINGENLQQSQHVCKAMCFCVVCAHRLNACVSP